jgi:hypothetical protein
VARQQLRHHAFVSGIEMLHEDESHLIVGRQSTEQLRASLKATGRGANADDRKISGWERRPPRWYGMATRTPRLSRALPRLGHLALTFTHRQLACRFEVESRLDAASVEVSRCGAMRCGEHTLTVGRQLPGQQSPPLQAGER